MQPPGLSELGMQCDWLQNEHESFPKPIILTSSSTAVHTTVLKCLSIVPVIDRLGTVQGVRIYGKTTGLPKVNIISIASRRRLLLSPVP
jgi:hypothetical protein